MLIRPRNGNRFTLASRDRWIVLSAAAMIGLVAAFYGFGVLGAPHAAFAIPMLVALASAGYVAMRPVGAPRSRGGWFLASLGGLATLVLGVVPPISSLWSRGPLATKDVMAAPDAIPLPRGAHGPVRLTARVDFAGMGDALVNLGISGAEEPIDIRLEKAAVRGEGRHRHLKNDGVEVPVVIGEGVRELKVERLEGQHRRPVRIAVLPPRPLPPWGPWFLGLLAVLAVGAISRRTILPEFALPVVGAVAGFTLFVEAVSNSGAPLRSVFAGLLFGTIPGALAAMIVGWAIRMPHKPSRRGGQRSNPSK